MTRPASGEIPLNIRPSEVGFSPQQQARYLLLPRPFFLTTSLHLHRHAPTCCSNPRRVPHTATDMLTIIDRCPAWPAVTRPGKRKTAAIYGGAALGSACKNQQQRPCRASRRSNVSPSCVCMTGFTGVRLLRPTSSEPHLGEARQANSGHNGQQWHASYLLSADTYTCSSSMPASGLHKGKS